MSQQREALAKQLIHEVGERGRIFSVQFTKRTDGTQRLMVCRLGVRKGLRGGPQAYNPADYALVTVWDVQAKGYRSISLDTVTTVKGRHKTWVLQ